MLRTIAILSVMAMSAGAQNPGAQDPPPIEVVGQLSGSPTGLVLTTSVRNVSTRNIQGYAYRITFTDPATGKGLGIRMGHGAYKKVSLGPALTPGQLSYEPKPGNIPETPSGAPANYSFTVDLVVFDDGTTWGPGQLRASQRLLTRIAAGDR